MFRKIFKTREIRNKLLFSLGVIALFRLMAHIPAPGVDVETIRAYLQGNSIFNLFNVFSGGAFQNFSIVTLGLAPYINASIVVQLFTVIVPSLEELSKEGESGRELLNQYTKLLTLPITLLQSYGVYFLLTRQGVLKPLDTFPLLILILSLTAGTFVLVWIGDLVNEYGLGNGISLLILAGILSSLPLTAYQFVSTIQSQGLVNSLVVLGVTLVVIASIVLVNEATRNIAVEYGRRSTGGSRTANYLPIKVNQAGVIPIIFAVSIVLIPSLLSAPLQASDVGFLQDLGFFLASNFTATSVLYNLVYFVLVMIFTYFYTTFQFNSEKISDDIKKRGGFIPGIRPGKSTERYLKAIISRITIAGAFFLGLVAVLPYILGQVFGLGSNFAIGGTGVLIVVSVILDTIRQIESMSATKSYENYL